MSDLDVVCTPWATWAVARLVGFRLDARLARGAATDGQGLLAARAGQLLTVRRRRHLAEEWDRLAEWTQRRWAHSPGRFRAGPLRDAIATAEAMHRVAEALRADRPVAPRGVAVAASVLADAAETARRVTTDGPDRAAALTREVLTALEPAAPAGGDPP